MCRYSYPNRAQYLALSGFVDSAGVKLAFVLRNSGLLDWTAHGPQAEIGWCLQLRLPLRCEKAKGTVSSQSWGFSYIYSSLWKRPLNFAPATSPLPESHSSIHGLLQYSSEAGFSYLISGLLDKRCNVGHFLLPFVKKTSASLKVSGSKRKERQPCVTELGRSSLLGEDPEAVPLCGSRPERL